MPTETANKFVILDSADNVAICCAPAEKGEAVMIGRRKIKLLADIGVGHKLAITAIEYGSKILKYGVSIGSATEEIAKGDHVHLHNMKSDYMPSYTRQTIQ